MAQPSDAPLLLVGFQSGVREALRRLQLPCVVLLDERAPDRDLGNIGPSLRVPLHGPSAPIEAAVRELLGLARGGQPPRAVVALGERTVVVAAMLRRAFGVAGNGPEVALRCADKVEMKRAMDAAGVPVAPWRPIDEDTRPAELVAELGLPLVVKPRRDSGGRGQVRVETEEELAGALALARRETVHERSYGWLAEGWVSGAEMSMEAFVHRGEVRFQSATEYYVPRHANIVPAPLEAEALAALQDLDARAIRAAGVERGITHLEAFFTDRGIVLGELAIRPPGGRLMTLMARAWDFDPWEAMIRLELGECSPFPNVPRCAAGVWILHPGSGQLAQVEGRAEARATPGVRRIALKVRPGDHLDPRDGSGQDIGAIYADGPDRDSVAASLSGARARLKFRLEPDEPAKAQDVAGPPERSSG